MSTDVAIGIRDGTFVNLDILPETELSCWENISLGSMESIWIKPFPSQLELDQSSSDIEEIGFLPMWDTVVTPVMNVELTSKMATATKGRCIHIFL